MFRSQARLLAHRPEAETAGSVRPGAGPAVGSRYAEGVDYIAPTDAELAAMTEDELLGFGSDPDDPFAGPSVEHPAGRYPVCVDSFTREEAEDMGAIYEDEPLRESWIDLKTRTLHHVPGCRCIRPSEVAAGCARST